jgi:hypothetical protein
MKRFLKDKAQRDVTARASEGSIQIAKAKKTPRKKKRQLISNEALKVLDADPYSKKSMALAKTLAFTNRKLGFPRNLETYQKNKKRSYKKSEKFWTYHDKRRKTLSRKLEESKKESYKKTLRKYKALLDSRLERRRDRRSC